MGENTFSPRPQGNLPKIKLWELFYGEWAVLNQQIEGYRNLETFIEKMVEKPEPELEQT